MLELKLITTEQELLSLKPAWMDLVEQSNSVTPFQTPSWLLLWWRHFGSGKLRVFTFCDEAGLHGVIPCFLHEWNGRKQLTLIGSGISDFLEPVLRVTIRDEIIDLLSRVLIFNDDWDLCDFQDLDADTALEKIEDHKRISLAMREDDSCMAIPLRGNFEEYWTRRSNDLRRNVRRYGERARDQGRLEFGAKRGACPELLDSLITLHAERWKKRGESGMIEANGSETFLRACAAEFGKLDQLLWLFLRFKGEIVAVLMTFPYRGSLYAYMSAFEPIYSAFGFGRLLLYESIRFCYENGFTTWHFLRGSEPYKFSWGGELILKRRILISRIQQ